MASGRTLLEVDEKKPLGFFPKLYESVVTNMGKEKLEEMERLTDDPESLISFTYSLDNFKRALTVRHADMWAKLRDSRLLARVRFTQPSPHNFLHICRTLSDP